MAVSSRPHAGDPVAGSGELAPLTGARSARSVNPPSTPGGPGRRFAHLVLLALVSALHAAVEGGRRRWQHGSGLEAGHFLARRTLLLALFDEPKVRRIGRP